MEGHGFNSVSWYDLPRTERRNRNHGGTRHPNGRTLTPYTKAWAKARGGK